MSCCSFSIGKFQSSHVVSAVSCTVFLVLYQAIDSGLSAKGCLFVCLIEHEQLYILLGPACVNNICAYRKLCESLVGRILRSGFNVDGEILISIPGPNWYLNKDWSGWCLLITFELQDSRFVSDQNRPTHAYPCGTILQ